MIDHPPAAAFTLRQLGPADAAQYRTLRLAGLRAFPHAFRRQFGLEPDAFLHDGKYYAKQHRQHLLVTPTS
jgi:hypothetical protein